MYLESSLMGISEALKGILGRLEVLESRSIGRREPSPPPPPASTRTLSKANVEKGSRGKAGGRTIAAPVPIPGQTGRKRERKRRKTSAAATPSVPIPTSVCQQSEERRGEATADAMQTPTEAPQTSWAKVVGRGATREKRVVGNSTLAPPISQGPSAPIRRRTATGEDTMKSTKRRVRRTAAVTLTGQGKIAKALFLAQKFKLEDLGIPELQVRAAFNGGIILEVSGENPGAQASLLATSIRAAI
jgi:hypothetical protein